MKKYSRSGGLRKLGLGAGAGCFVALLVSCNSLNADEGTTSAAASSSAPLPRLESRVESKTAARSKKGSRGDQFNDSAEYHFSLAQAYASDGDPDRAIEEYKITLMHDPSSALVHARLASEYVKKGMLTAAMEECKESLKINPDFSDARFILAGLYSTTHETKLAVAEYDKILEKHPNHEEAQIYKSQALLEGGQLEKAVQNLKDHTRKSPDSAIAWYYLARAEQQLDHMKESEASYRKALQLRPGFTQAALALGYLYEERQMTKQALEVYHELYEDSQDVAAAARLVTLLLKEEKYKETIPYLMTISASDPDDLNSQVKLGLVYMELKKFVQAIEIFKKILAKNPESDRIHYYLGSLYEETRQFDLAIEELKRIKSDSKLYGDATLHSANMLRQLNRLPAARQQMADALSKGPSNPNFYLFAASLEEEGSNVSKAVAVLVKGAKEFPDDEKIKYYLGSLYDRLGEADKGLEQMEGILKVNPNNVDALNYIGYTWTIKGVRLNDAEKLIKKALTLKPNNGYIQDSWGWHLFIRGRIKESVIELEKAVSMKPNEATILDHLGDAYLRSNLPEKALLQYTAAAQHADEGLKKKIMDKVENMRRETVLPSPVTTTTSTAK